MPEGLEKHAAYHAAVCNISTCMPYKLLEAQCAPHLHLPVFHEVRRKVLLKRFMRSKALPARARFNAIIWCLNRVNFYKFQSQKQKYP